MEVRWGARRELERRDGARWSMAGRAQQERGAPSKAWAAMEAASAAPEPVLHVGVGATNR
ncbi:hypothetical protein Zm00014a_031539 [Zea mays]|uniref:Uncharacterized protein n=1 Tax=Zea mays TaxID=4577 RepID=A0A3L6DLT3_MAIZE|nr:hypothetical protein Zm00014a_031539 [Zea mays]